MGRRSGPVTPRPGRFPGRGSRGRGDRGRALRRTTGSSFWGCQTSTRPRSDPHTNPPTRSVPLPAPETRLPPTGPPVLGPRSGTRREKGVTRPEDYWEFPEGSWMLFLNVHAPAPSGPIMHGQESRDRVSPSRGGALTVCRRVGHVCRGRHRRELERREGNNPITHKKGTFRHPYGVTPPPRHPWDPRSPDDPGVEDGTRRVLLFLRHKLHSL